MPSLLSSSSSSTSKTIGTTTAPNPHSVTTSSTNSTMVTSSALVPPSVDVKPSSSSTLLPRKDSNASSSGAFSEVSRSFGHEENSTDSLYGLTSSSSSSHYVIKCNLNTATTTTNTSSSSTSTPTSPLPPPTPPPPVTLAPRVKVTVQQPSITTRQSRFDSSADPIPSSTFLKTPASDHLPLSASSSSKTTASIASSAPEFSISGASSVDSEESALYEQYLSISYARQSNPSPEIRKQTCEDWTNMQQRTLTRSKSEANTAPMEQSQHNQQQQKQQPQQTTTSQIKPVSKFFLLLTYDIFVRSLLLTF